MKNILFIMYDQLRFDYLSCAGHPHLQTPNFDRVAAKGVRFTNAYVQSPICGASRMSFYTGRYVSSHGAAWNCFPLRVGELTLGDHLRDAGMDCWLLGKTHMKADKEGMARLGLSPDSLIGARQAECGFDTWVRDDGLWGVAFEGPYDEKPSPYNEYLRSKGYDGDNPWADYANSGVEGENMASGWFIENADRPANIAEEDSETPWLTREAIKFVDEAEGPWCAHVSYIKPHWPYIVPAPYHNMYNRSHILNVSRHEAERIDPQPVYAEFMNNTIATTFQRDEAREKAVVAYMGLIKQCDDQLGVLLDHLEKTGKDKETVVVLTSDHGDYLGDHWLGEKDLFHEQSAKIPLIIYDPSDACDGTRGTSCDVLVESIDVTATLIEMAGGKVPTHIVEGRSLVPFLQGQTIDDWRQFVISEYDYSVTPMCANLGLAFEDARLFMVFDGRYKLIHAEGGFRPILFDLKTDPEEFHDLGNDPNQAAVIGRLYAHLFTWSRRMSQRVTLSDAAIASMRGSPTRRGILVGVYNADEMAERYTRQYTGPARKRRFEGPSDQ